MSNKLRIPVNVVTQYNKEVEWLKENRPEVLKPYLNNIDIDFISMYGFALNVGNTSTFLEAAFNWYYSSEDYWRDIDEILSEEILNV